MINLRDFNEVFIHYKGAIRSLTARYRLFDFENDILTKLWTLTQKIDTSKFKTQEGLDNFIFISLKNFCITLCKKNSSYSEHNVLCFDKEDFFHNSLVEMDSNFSNVVFEDLLLNLKAREQKIIRYKFKNNLSDIEIGKILGISRQAVNKALKKSLISLKKEVA